jgi:hypothetical protein
VSAHELALATRALGHDVLRKTPKKTQSSPTRPTGVTVPEQTSSSPVGGSGARRFPNGGFRASRFAFPVLGHGRVATDKFRVAALFTLRRWPADLLSSGEGLDDEHRCAAVSAHEGGPHGTDGDGVIGSDSNRLMQQLANIRDAVLAVGVGEQAVVADAMKAGGQHMQQAAAHELVGCDGHGFVAGAPVLAMFI